MQTDNHRPEIRIGALAGFALLTAIAYITIYTSLHEAGHALTGLYSGQKLSGFSRLPESRHPQGLNQAALIKHNNGRLN